tara:strand:- start:3594 stop:4010 length:417 start_codon:yes stop_codon:yes gene_type:complete
MNTNKLKEIYKKYNLEKDDIFVLKFGGKDKPIITRAGIEKIQAQLDISVNFKIEKISEDHKSCIILAQGAIMKEVEGPQGSTRQPLAMAQSFGEVSPANNKSNFPICMAEKRGLARVVLKMANLAGFYSEDEAEEFNK